MILAALFALLKFAAVSGAILGLLIRGARALLRAMLALFFSWLLRHL